MRPVVGIVCEYDPFHRGHARQFELIREKLPGAGIVCVMSGCFTQRGMPALFAPAFRAEAALRAGADLVLELPCAFAVRDAENFALGAVGLISALGFVTHLSFGCETDDLSLLSAVAALLEQPNAAFSSALRTELAMGRPFVAAQAAAILAGLRAGPASGHKTPAAGEYQPDANHPLPPGIPQEVGVQPTTSAAFSDEPTTVGSPDSRLPEAAAVDPLARALTRPNNILGICYLRAIRRLHSGLRPLPVLREGEYHAASLTSVGYPSASAARRAFLSGDLRGAETACGYPLSGVPCHRPDALDAVLLHRLRTMDPAALRALPDCSEGLEHRLIAAAQRATDREQLLAGLKTRRYPRARLSRLAAHALLSVTAELLAAHPAPESVRLLGFRRASRDCLAALGQSPLAVIAKAADGDRTSPPLQLEERAYDLWALGAGLPAGLLYRQQVVACEAV